MKAVVLRGHGDLDQVGVADVPAPALREPGDVLVRIRAAALNHLDLWTIRGLPGLTLRFPHVLGGDGAGTVEAAGADVRTVSVGQRVLINPGVACYRCEFCHQGEHSLCESFRLLGEHLPGTLAEFVVVPEQNVAPIPSPPAPHPAITWAEAAAFPLVTLTAWRMLVTRARVRPGECVVVWGVGGGVSGTAVRIAKLMGAFVVATSSSDEKLEAASAWGADVTLNYQQVDVAREVRALTGKRGADVIVDNVGEATWEQSLRMLGRQGRLVTCGATTGPKVMTDVRRLFWYQHTILGSTMGNAAEFREILQLLGQGRLRPVVDSRFPFERAVNALERLSAGRQTGKIVVDL
ncbi:MAG TPA: zinc-binding dehydrogenase [Gemmatimonadales bacterium]|nr:zinc-binding dehydrogenase [Gemmatimonadales bacterium]